MKQFILAVVIPAFIAAYLFASAEYIDNPTYFKIQVWVAWIIAIYVGIFLAVHFAKKEKWFK